MNFSHILTCWILISRISRGNEIGSKYRKLERYRIKTTVKETQRKRLLVRAIEKFEKWRVHSSRNVIPLQQDINATKLFWNKRQVLELNTYLQDLLDGYNYRYNETLTMLILDLFSKQGIRDRA